MRLIGRLLGAALAVLAMGGTSEIDAFVQAAEDQDVVILGEVHDNPAHHANQARIVEALQPEALVFEMIPQEREDLVNELREKGSTRGELAEALEWEKSGWPPFEQYAQILEAAPQARVFGGGQPEAEIKRAMVEGAAGPFGPDAALYGLNEPLAAEEQVARERQMADAHCDALPPEVLAGMVEAQRFRDAGLADAALWARTMTGDGQVVVITGNGHADIDLGVPRKLRTADPDVTILSLGQLESPPAGEAAAPYDHVLVTEPAKRDADPCEDLAR
jgi:uncharacterized iron-regulated protein